jgi:hypothetical protein
VTLLMHCAQFLKGIAQNPQSPIEVGAARREIQDGLRREKTKMRCAQ